MRYHVSGQLKVAPEHVSPRVLRAMGKPPLQVFQQFVDQYQAVNRRLIQHIRFQRTQPHPTDARYGAGGLYCVTERSTPLLTVGGEVDTGQYHFRIPFCRQLAQLLRQLFQRL